MKGQSSALAGVFFLLPAVVRLGPHAIPGSPPVGLMSSFRIFFAVGIEDAAAVDADETR